MARSSRLGTWIGVVLLLGAACAVVVDQPWHGPVLLSVSSTHGIDAGDLPAVALFALALALATMLVRARDDPAANRRFATRLAGPACALAVGALLLAGVFDDEYAKALVPAGGGTLGGTTEHADGQQADPMDDWTHLAVTYDGSMLRLYVDGTPVSSRAATGSILGTTKPLWIGGNHPYGEYFQGLIDEVRVYNLALSPSKVRTEMSTPIRGSKIASPEAGLVAAYAFDGESKGLAADSSGNGNAGVILGATRTRGRFGGALRFDGDTDVVRVPPSASLNLRSMTLSGWIKAGGQQGGWRTSVHRQTDAYFLMAGGGGIETRLGPLDDARAALLFGTAIVFCLVLASGRAQWFGTRRRRWWLPVVLFLAGSVVDEVLVPSVTLAGATLVAIWFALTATRRSEAILMYVSAAVFTSLSLMSLAGWDGLQPARDDGGIARSAALGVLFVVAALLSTYRAPRWTKGHG
jgi:hypothetical protein